MVNFHVDGIPWYEAPLPRRWHWCKAHTSGLVNDAVIDRCACGAIRMDGSLWMERNSRRKFDQHSRGNA